jgi:tetratricopeptide (TPR) repeat protein
MSEADSLVRQGIAALKAGQKQRARDLLTQAVELNERHEQAWLWLSAAVDKLDEREICLENVLTINPDNSRARRGLETVRSKLGLAPLRHPHEAGQPALDEADRRRPTLQKPASWQEAVPQSQAEPQEHFGSGSFLASLGVQVPAQARHPKKKRSLLDGLNEGAQARAVAKQKAKERGLLALLDAWISALIFDSRGAYEAERDVATIGRTTLSVIIGVAVATFLLAIGMFLGLARVLTVWGEGLPFGFGALVGEGANFAGTATILTTPFLVIDFFVIAFAMQKAAALFGSDLDFFESAHLFSISFAPTITLLSFILMVNFLLAAFMLGSINPYTDTWSAEELAAIERYEQLSPIFAGALGVAFVYSLVVWAHGLGVAHGIGIIGGVFAVIVGLILSVILSGLVCCGLNFMMSVGNPNVY